MAPLSLFIQNKVVILWLKQFQKMIVMETRTSGFPCRTRDEIVTWFNRAKARQLQLEAEGRKQWEEEQRMKIEAKQYYELEYA